MEKPKHHPFLGCPKCKKLTIAERLMEDGRDGRGSPIHRMKLVCDSCGHLMQGHLKPRK